MKRLKIGIALSGGTWRRARPISGSCAPSSSTNIAIDYLAGTSGGAIVAAFYAAGKIDRRARGAGLRACTGRTSPGSRCPVSDSFRARRSGDSSRTRSGTSSSAISRFPSRSSHPISPRERAGCSPTGKVALACQASSAVPEFYTPVEIDGHLFIDGGLSEYVPVDALASLGDMFTGSA